MVEVLESTVFFEGRVFSVRQDRLRLANGRVIKMDTVVHNDAVTILPVDSNGDIWFIRQYRHSIRREILELPAGVVEMDEDPREGALRELREEIGMAAGSLSELGGFFLAPGYSTEYMHVYFGTDLSESPLPGDETEVLQVEKISAREAYHLAKNGTLIDSKSLVALFWAKPYLTQIGLI